MKTPVTVTSPVLEVLRKEFVEELSAGQYKQAQETLGIMFDYYMAIGFTSHEEKNEFEGVVLWFDQEIVEKGFLSPAAQLV